MNKQPRIKFYLEQRRDKKTGKIKTTNVPIIFSLSYGRRYKSSTGYSIDANLWDQEHQRIKSSCTDAMRINRKLEKIRGDLMKICDNADHTDIPLSNGYISEKLRKDKMSKKGFFAILQEFIDENKDNWQPGTITKFTTIKKHLEDFSRLKRVRVEFDELNDTFFKKLLAYYFEETETKEAYRNSYVRKLISFLGQFLTWAAKNDYNKNMSFKSWRLESGNRKEDARDNIISLTPKEFLAIYNLKTDNQKLQRTRDYVVLAVGTGLRFSDIANLKKTDINFKDERFVCNTKKTGARVEMYFNQFSREIFMKYKDVRIIKNGIDMMFPCTSNQKMNYAIKELGEAVEIDTPVTTVHYQRNRRIEETGPKYKFLSSHVCRKTFTTLNVGMGTPSEVTMDMTQHKTYDSFKRYVGISDAMKREAMSRFTVDNLLEYAHN